MIEHYYFLGQIPKNEFYFRSKRVEQDGRILAGLTPNQLMIIKELLPNKTYYYTVVAVNNRRVFHPHATPVAGVPRNNAPEVPVALHSVYVEDTNELKFEWDSPMYREDMRTFIIYAVQNAGVYEYWRQDLLNKRAEND
jgi:hypothetical protein